MNPKFRFPAVFFMASLFLVVTGLTFKIMHWEGGNTLFPYGMMFMMIAIIIVIVALLRVKSN
jgi:hypothetical protein